MRQPLDACFTLHGAPLALPKRFGGGGQRLLGYRNRSLVFSGVMGRARIARGGDRGKEGDPPALPPHVYQKGNDADCHPDNRACQGL